MKSTLAATALFAVLSGVLAKSGCGGCSDSSTTVPPHPPPDPWTAKLEQLQKDYDANQSKLMVDWRSAMHDAQADKLNSDKLVSDIAVLEQEMNDDRGKLAQWNQELSAELHRRGLQAAGE